MIDSMRQKTRASIRRVCEVLELPRSSYHATAKPTPTQLADDQLGRIIGCGAGSSRRGQGRQRAVKKGMPKQEAEAELAALDEPSPFGRTSAFPSGDCSFTVQNTRP